MTPASGTRVDVSYPDAEPTFHQLPMMDLFGPVNGA
jgi:hypothetical protein